MIRRQGWACVLAAVVGMALAHSGEAGILDGHPSALPGWSGTVPYDNGNNLAGTIDFAVFSAADFNANFSGLGYTPGDAYVYTYQVLNGGTDNFSALTVGINNPANTIGTFDIGTTDASLSIFDGSGNAEWQFVPAVAAGSDSWGLAFSAPTVPELGIGLVLDGGGSLLLTGLPTPSIPEPSSVVLVALAGGFGGVLLLRRRG